MLKYEFMVNTCHGKNTYTVLYSFKLIWILYILHLGVDMEDISSEKWK